MIVPGIKHVPGRNDYTDRDGRKYGVAVHNTSNDAPAAGEASYATRRTDGVSAHFYVDDREVIQSIDTKYRTGHAGSSEGNENAVSVEITGTNAKTRAWWIANVAWDELGRVLAEVCRAYDIEPRRATVAEMKSNPRVRAFYSHDDMRRAWGGTTHTDPGGNFPWDYLFAAVKQAMAPVQEDELSAEELLNTRLVDPTTGTEHMVRDFLRYGEYNTREQVAPVLAQVAALRAEVAKLAGRDLVDERQVAAELAPALLAVLTPQAIAAAIPADIAEQVADELAARLTAPQAG